MKQRILRTVFSAAFLVLAGGGHAAAVEALGGLQASPASTLKVLGDSTMHKWELDAKQLTISASLKAGKGDLLGQVGGGAVQSLKLSLAVETLKSTEGSGMDHNAYKALDSAKFPEISFELKSYTVAGQTVTAQGTLSIHGVAKAVELKALLTPAAKGIEVKGSYDLLMSDYGVKPPVMMLGTIRVTDKVTIAFDDILVQP